MNPSKFEQHTKTAIAEPTIATQPNSKIEESPETKANNFLSSAKTNFLNNELFTAKENAKQALALNSTLDEAKQLLVTINRKEEDIKSAQANEKWTKENIINKLKVDEVLEKEVDFIYTGIGSIVEPHDTSMGKTNLKNAYTMELSVAKNGKTITNDSQRKEVAFNIAKAINDNFSKIDFNLSEVVIHFADTDNPLGFGGGNFDLGINTIKNYFSKPRSQSGYIDGSSGEVVALDFDSASFYKWIENNFTMPEDHSVLTENYSWTTMSQKGAIK
ncbi:hypothetical protein [Desulfosporosinus sp. BG]|uniref:hypothetical protein n=1 Tax=Desulfosporosinus sp. BG TaxID=1633135 RepID=UPI00083A6860|nr:hypothetical protein [Desulfosporosinus sp. BG]